MCKFTGKELHGASSRSRKILATFYAKMYESNNVDFV